MGKISFYAVALLFIVVFPAQAAALSPGKLHWIVNLHAIDLLREQGSEGAALVDEFFANERTFVTLKVDGNFSRLPAHCLPTVSFTNYESMRKKLESGRLDPRIRAVLYDAENWEFTPDEEKREPARYHALAAKLAHKFHLQLIATPAANLVKAMEPQVQDAKYEEYLRLKIAEAAARDADVYEIQAQGAQPAPDRFADFVQRAAAQARAAHPGVVVLAGLSTNPSGQKVSADQLLEGVQRTSGSVDGYWLNIPGGGPYCPKCGEPKPAIALELLKRLKAAHDGNLGKVHP
jgi:Tfp pilus assembly protein PilV